MNKKEILSNINDIYKDYRKMSTQQIVKKYGGSINTIKIALQNKGFIIDKSIINSNLLDEEIIFMYDSLLNNEIKTLTNGMLTCKNRIKYAVIIFKHLINDILRWNREDIINNYNSEILNKYFLRGIIIGIKTNTIGILKLSFPEYNIKPWELKSSSVGNGFWNDENINDALLWLKNKILIEKGIDNINKCGQFGFEIILREYKLEGMKNCVFTRTVELFEKMYNCKYNKEDMLKDNFTFKINPKLIIETKLINEIYIIDNKYYTLNDIEKTLCNEIIRYCEENKKYPQEKDMSNKNGYISRSQYKKVFGDFKNINNYIISTKFLDIQNKRKLRKNRVVKSFTTYEVQPQICKCIKCKKDKPFNEQYFVVSKNAKFGLSYLCKKCATEKEQVKSYKKLGINIDSINDLTIEEWWDLKYNNVIQVLPKKLHNEKNYIKVIQYIVFNLLKLRNKDEIVEWFITDNLRKYGIIVYVSKLGGKLKSLQICFPEMKFSEDDFDKYTETNTLNILDSYIENINIANILNGKINIRSNKVIFALFSHYQKLGMGINDLWIWYFNKKNIVNPQTNEKINKFDFTNKPTGFYENRENRIDIVKYYCEKLCEDSILNNFDNTDNLKIWTYKYFRQSQVSKIFSYTKYYNSLFGLLIDCYPKIKEKNLLFEWELGQCSKNDKYFLIQMLREYVLYRMRDLIDNIESDIPTYMNFSYFKSVFPKMLKHIHKHRFTDFYEWICLSFPEYKDIWKKEDFGMITAKDGTTLDSFAERDVYEFIQSNDIFKFINPIGKKRSGKYIFKLNEDYDYGKFCPDFVIEYVFINNKKIKLSKPIIVEYYGMYDKNSKFKAFKDYVEKTSEKEKFYKSNKDIYYIGIYPDDTKNNFEGLAKKLGSFYLENLLNIEFNNVNAM